MPARKLGVALKSTFEQSCGRTLHVTSRMMEMSFPTAFSRLRAPFYRTKITTWMASQEEEFRQAALQPACDDAVERGQNGAGMVFCMCNCTLQMMLAQQKPLMQLCHKVVQMMIDHKEISGYRMQMQLC